MAQHVGWNKNIGIIYNIFSVPVQKKSYWIESKENSIYILVNRMRIFNSLVLVLFSYNGFIYLDRNRSHNAP